MAFRASTNLLSCIVQTGPILLKQLFVIFPGQQLRFGIWVNSNSHSERYKISDVAINKGDSLSSSNYYNLMLSSTDGCRKLANLDCQQQCSKRGERQQISSVLLAQPPHHNPQPQRGAAPSLVCKTDAATEFGTARRAR